MASASRRLWASSQRMIIPFENMGTCGERNHIYDVRSLFRRSTPVCNQAEAHSLRWCDPHSRGPWQGAIEQWYCGSDRRCHRVRWDASLVITTAGFGCAAGFGIREGPKWCLQTGSHGASDTFGPRTQQIPCPRDVATAFILKSYQCLDSTAVRGCFWSNQQ